MKIDKNKLANAAGDSLMAIGGGVASEILMDVMDTKVPGFGTDPMYSPLAVLTIGILGQAYAPKAYENVFIGMQVVSGVELARSQGIIKGINTALGDIVPDIFDKASRTVPDEFNKNPYVR